MPPEEAQRIEEIVRSFMDAIGQLVPGSPAVQRRVGDATSLGEREIRAISAMSARMTDGGVEVAADLFEETAPVARALGELRRAVERLDPSAHDLASRRPFGFLRRSSSLERYFDSYAESEGHIRHLIGDLRDGRSELERRNAMIVQERRSLAISSETLRRYSYLAQRLDEAVDAAAAAAAETDPARSRFLAGEVLLPIRQRRRDILTHLAVSAQGLAALAIIEANNEQLIRAIETVTTTTVAALRTAVLVAQALTNDHSVAAQLKSVTEFAASVGSDAGALAARAEGGQGAGLAALQGAWDGVSAALTEVEARQRNAQLAVRMGRLEPGTGPSGPAS